MPLMWVIYLAAAAVFMYAAACIWLTVRVINRRERRAKWSLAALLSMPALYFTSAPAMGYLVNHGLLPVAIAQVLGVVFYPIGYAFNGGAPDWLRDGLVWYLMICGGHESPSARALILPTLIVAFVALCVWRTVNRRVKRNDC